MGYRAEYDSWKADPEGWWMQAAQAIDWVTAPTQALTQRGTHFYDWFADAQVNTCYNAVDRHVNAGRGDQVAIIHDSPITGKKDTISYAALKDRVALLAGALAAKGITTGDRVIIYMPMVPESAVAMLACARIGAVHSVVFAGFSASSLADRINDCEAKVVLTSDGNFRGKKTIPVKAVVDEALENTSSIEKVIVLKRTETEVTMQPDRDVWWHEVTEGISTENKAEEMDSEDMLFILYTSGSTGKPKGVVHTCGGYMVYTHYTFENVFQYNRGDVYWCTADIGWITGHSYIVYGPLLAGATTLMFEGVPTYPDASRFWKVVDKYQVKQFYTAPTAIRALQAYGLEPLQDCSLESLKVIGSVGEPINEEAWNWYRDHVGKGKCPLVDTWWQTETGGVLISPIPGVTPTKPGYATLPLPGVQPIIVDADGKELKGNSVQGNLCIKFPWPSMLRTTYGDHERCRQTYFSTYKGLYFTGDGVKRDEDGYYRILGRVDDVINVSGHRMGTAEVENAINEHPKVVESAVVGYPHDIKGQGIYAYVICDLTDRSEENLANEIRQTVSQIIGPIAKPDKIQLVPGLPKTRSGKIMRRILRKIAQGDTSNLGDTSTLLNPEVVTQIMEGEAS